MTLAVDAPVDGVIQRAEFTASGTVYTFKGFLEAYEEGRDEKRSDADKADDQSLPVLAVGDTLRLKEVEPKGHATTPKPRYTEASLVKALEEKGIGRPSTFASIIDVILDRGYVTKRGQALVPSWLAFSVIRLLEEHFADLVDYDFTAALEDDLDAIARGEQQRTAWLRDFYFGSEAQPGLRNIVENLGEIDARELNATPISDTTTLRFGKYGPYLDVVDPADPEAPPRRVNIPEDLAPDELTAREGAGAHRRPRRGQPRARREPRERQARRRQGRPLRAVHRGDRARRIPPRSTSRPARSSTRLRRRRAAKKDAAPKPRTASLFKSMSVDTIDLETALRLLDLPRTVGTDPESGEPITAQNGRYGPYLKKGTDSRTLDSEQLIFDITLEQALAIYALPKYGARRRVQRARRVRQRPGQRQADPRARRPIRRVCDRR